MHDTLYAIREKKAGYFVRDEHSASPRIEEAKFFTRFTDAHNFMRAHNWDAVVSEYRILYVQDHN